MFKEVRLLHACEGSTATDLAISICAVKVRLSDRLGADKSAKSLHIEDFLHIGIRIFSTAYYIVLMREVLKTVSEVINVSKELGHVLMKVHTEDRRLHQGLIHDFLRVEVQLWPFVWFFEHLVGKLFHLFCLRMYSFVV